MNEPAGAAARSADEPEFETVWTNWPAVILFALGMAATGYWSLQPGTAGTFPFGFPWVLGIEVVWLLIALQNARLRLTILDDRMVMRAMVGSSRELGRPQWGCLQVADPVTISWWRRWWSGSGRHSVLVAAPGSPCRSLFVPAALTGMPLPRGQEDRVMSLLSTASAQD